MTLYKNSFIIKWGIKDIISRGDSLGFKINKAKARIILARIYNNHDCNIGINWDVIDSAIECY